MLALFKQLVGVATSSISRSDGARNRNLVSLTLAGAVLGEIVLCGIIIGVVACERAVIPYAYACMHVPVWYVAACCQYVTTHNLLQQYSSTAYLSHAVAPVQRTPLLTHDDVLPACNASAVPVSTLPVVVKEQRSESCRILSALLL